MQVPVEIVFRNCEPTEAIRAEVEKCVQRLEKFSDRLTSCHVVIQAPETRHRHGDAYKVVLRIAMPRHKDIVVDRMPADEGENGYPLVAIRNAFAAAVRQGALATRSRAHRPVHRCRRLWVHRGLGRTGDLFPPQCGPEGRFR